MKRIAILFLLITFIQPIYAKGVVLEVSKAYTQRVEGKCKIKMHSLKDAFDYCNKYKGIQKIEIVLKDDVNTIDTTLLLRGTKVPIILRAKKEMSIITSGNVIDKGLVQRGDTLAFPYTKQCWKLLVNGKDAPIANTFTVKESMNQLIDVHKVDDYNYTAKFNRDDILKLELGCDLFLYTRWQCYKMQVTEIDLLTYTVSLSSMGNKAFYATDEGVRYAIYNSKKVMQPGTFCYKDGMVHYLRRQGENVSHLRFSIPNVATLVKIFECKNVTFQNVSFENAVLEDWYFQEIQGSALCSKAIHVEYSTNINFRNCDFHNNMGYSLAIGNNSSNCSVSGCCFSDLQGGGIILGMEGGDNTNNITITDNLIKCYGRVNVCCEGILSQRAHYVTITDNTICDGYYTGLSLGWTWGFDKSYSYGNYVANNHIHHIMQGILDDGGGIYTLGIQNGTIVENNYIHDIFSDKEMACLIYMDEGSSGIIVRNNVCFASNRGISLSFGRSIIIQNNVICDVDKWGIRLSYPKKNVNLLVIRNTIIGEIEVAIDSNISNSSLFDNEIITDELKKLGNNISQLQFKTMSFLCKKNYLEKKFKFGCKTGRLKAVEISGS